jgi:hypothetical protein
MRLCAEAARRASAGVGYGSLAQPFHLSQRPARVVPTRMPSPAVGASFGQYPPVVMVFRSIGLS